MTASNVKTKARHKARCLLVQALYQQRIAEHDFSDIEDEYITDEFSEGADLSYFVKILRGIAANMQKIDENFSEFLDIAIHKLDVIELSILRIATYELLHEQELSHKIIINEAIELAKTYGGQDGHKFVNGVLNQVAKKIRSE